MWINYLVFCCKLGKMSQIYVFRWVCPDYYDITYGRLSKFITILHGGGGLPDLLQYYNGGWSLGTQNLYYVIYGRPLRPSMPPPWHSLTLKAFPLPPRPPKLLAWVLDPGTFYTSTWQTWPPKATPTTLTTLTILTKLTTLTILATLTDQKIHNEHKYRFCIVYLVYLYNY